MFRCLGCSEKYFICLLKSGQRLHIRVVKDWVELRGLIYQSLLSELFWIIRCRSVDLDDPETWLCFEHIFVFFLMSRVYLHFRICYQFSSDFVCVQIWLLQSLYLFSFIFTLNNNSQRIKNFTTLCYHKNLKVCRCRTKLILARTSSLPEWIERIRHTWKSSKSGRQCVPNNPLNLSNLGGLLWKRCKRF